MPNLYRVRQHVIGHSSSVRYAKAVSTKLNGTVGTAQLAVVSEEVAFKSRCYKFVCSTVAFCSTLSTNVKLLLSDAYSVTQLTRAREGSAVRAAAAAAAAVFTEGDPGKCIAVQAAA